MKKQWENTIDRPLPAAGSVPAELRVGGVRIAPATVLAPMAGVTDTVFRRFIKNASLYSPEASLTPAGVDRETSNERSGWFHTSSS